MNSNPDQDHRNENPDLTDPRTVAADRAQAAAAPEADRPPTPEEEQAAEAAAAGIDLDAVGAHFEEMSERGANVEGEGSID